MIRYRFKKKRWMILVALLDSAGESVRCLLSFFFPFWRRRRKPLASRILVVRLDHIGDVLLSTPAIAELRRSFPDAFITVLVGPWAAEVLRGNSCIDDLQVFRAPWFDRGENGERMVPALYREAMRLRIHAFDIGVDLRGDIRNLALLALARIPFRVGYADQGGGFLLNQVVPRRKYQQEVYRSLDVVHAMTSETEGRAADFMPPRFDLDSSAHVVARDYLSPFANRGKGPLVAIHPGAGCSSKLWDTTKFASVSNALWEKRRARLVLTGSIAECRLVGGIARLLKGPFLDLAGKLTLKELGAVFQHCDLIVTVDGGAMHIAAAVGTPVVSAFCSMTTLDEWRPFGEGHVAIRKEVPCGGCELEVCPKPLRCMDLITAGEILKASETLLERRASP